MEDTPFQKLRQFLTKLPAGAVPLDAKDELVTLLADCWHMFSGSTQEEMQAYKLARMEEPMWEPPVLSFTIERHGATAMGSTRAELQGWNVDIDRGEAKCYAESYRQLYPRAAFVDVKPIADEIAKLIVCQSKDERLQWSARGRVRVLTRKIFGSIGVPKQTFEGRRRRFLNALEERLAPHGWHCLDSPSWWERKE